MRLSQVFRSDHQQQRRPLSICHIHSKWMHIKTIQACPPFWLPLSNKGLQRLSCSALVPTEKAIQKKKEKPSVSTILKRVQKAIGITFPDGREVWIVAHTVHETRTSGVLMTLDEARLAVQHMFSVCLGVLHRHGGPLGLGSLVEIALQGGRRCLSGADTRPSSELHIWAPRHAQQHEYSTSLGGGCAKSSTKSSMLHSPF